VTRRVADRSASPAALAAIEAMAKSFALELAPLHVNVIAPGLTKSPLSRQVLGDRADEVFKARSAALPARRVAEPDDIAAMMLSILKNPYITPETVRLDGGAGAMNIGVTEAFTTEQVKQQFDVNVFGAVRTDRAVLPYMRQARSGLLLHVSSLAGRAVFPFFGAYCASKFALEALAEAYHYELSAFGIDSIIVEPGPFPSNLLPASPAPSGEKRLSEYPEAVKISNQLRDGFKQMYESSNPPRTMDVVDAFVRLIESTEKRPLRTVVMPTGMDFGVERLNQAIAPIQNELLKSLGLANML
jgi:NAD(P)-dependent dehydrogenase (short-subunit alcohol dehydrogenase family)